MSTSWMRSNGIERWVRLRIPLSMRISLAPTRYSKRRQYRNSRHDDTSGNAGDASPARRQLPVACEIADRRRSAADHLSNACAEPGDEVERMEPFGRADRQVSRCSREVRADMLADDVADFGGAIGGEAIDGDDAVMRAGGVDDEAGGAEHFVERAAGDVEMLDADERDERVGVEHPAVDAVQHAVGQPVAEAAVLALRDDR